jgi:hypothetical protein
MKNSSPRLHQALTSKEENESQIRRTKSDPKTAEVAARASGDLRRTDSKQEVGDV